MGKPVLRNTTVPSMLLSLPGSNALSILHSFPLPHLLLSHMPANTISQNNVSVKADAVIRSCDRPSILIGLLAGSLLRELSRDLLATAPSHGSHAMTWLLLPSL